MGSPRLRHSLAWKLFVLQLAVILAGSAALALVAVVIGPKIFHRHVTEALGFVPSSVLHHLDTAFAEALWLSLAIGIAAATLTAVSISWIASHRIVQPIRDLADAAREISRGDYQTRVEAGGSDEVGVLACSFNEMAASLESAEDRRRRLLSDVAHELRTPLTTIDAYLEGLADGVVQPSPETWGIMRAEAARLGRLTEDVSEVSKAEERQLDLRVHRVPVTALLEAAAHAAAPTYEAKGVTLVVRPVGRRLDVDADPDRLGQVLTNLLSNALRHTPAQGIVTLAAEEEADGVLLSVTDTGDGIAADDLERVFERFYRADPSRARKDGGSGIGLTVARAIVRAHEGQLWAESDGTGHGARFVCRLPALG